MDNLPDNACHPKGTFVKAGPNLSSYRNPYSNDTWQAVINVRLNGQILNSPGLNLIHQQKKFPCMSTCQIRNSQYITISHMNPKGTIGIHGAEKDLQGEN